MTQEVSKRVKMGSLYKRVLSFAAVLAIALMIVPMMGKNNLFSNQSAKAAGAFIESSIKATELVKSFAIKLKVRTLANDNFALVGTEYEMADHKIWKSVEEPVCWRVDKGGRIVVFDGKSQYLWVQKTELALKSGSNANFTEWLKILLEPEKVLAKEQEGIKTNGSKFTMNEKDGELKMTITSKAQGNFINDYCKNKSINESDNRREYTFDSNTKLLKALKIFVLKGKKESLILEIEQIDYNIKIEPSLFAIELPKDIKWKDLAENLGSDRFKNISSKKAAELFFEGMANKDWNLVEEACYFFKNSSSKITEIKEGFGGLQVIKIGKPFKSGLYPGEFVPYEIKLPSGKLKKANLAVRNDNPNKAWTVDGGF